MITNWHRDETPSTTPPALPAYSGEEASFGEAIGKGLLRGPLEIGQATATLLAPLIPSRDSLPEFVPEFVPDKEDAFSLIEKMQTFKEEHLTPSAKEFTVAKQLTYGISMLPGMLAGGVEGLLAAGINPGADLVTQGVDSTTATEAALLNLGGTAAAVGLPAAGQTLGQTVALVAAGTALGAGQDAAVSALLQGRGYDEQALQYDPMNPVARIMDLGVGGAFGYLNMRGIQVEQAARNSLRQAELDAVDTVAQVKQAAASAPSAAAAAAHGQTVTAAAEALSNGAKVQVDAPPAPPRYGLVSFYQDLIAPEKYALSEEQADAVLTKVALFAITRGEEPEAWVGRAIKGVEGHNVSEVLNSVDIVHGYGNINEGGNDYVNDTSRHRQVDLNLNLVGRQTTFDFDYIQTGSGGKTPSGAVHAGRDAGTVQPDNSVSYYRVDGKDPIPVPLNAILRQITDHVQTGTFKSDIDLVTSADEAASILSPIAKKSREQFLILALDSSGRPISVLDVSSGSLNSSIVHPRESVAAALNFPGVASLWFAHNHPSGDPLPSPEDLSITDRLRNLVDAANVQVNGHIILGDKGQYINILNSGLTAKGSFVEPSGKNIVPQIGAAVFSKRVESDNKRLSSVMDVAVAVQNNGDGILLLNNKNAPVGFVNLSAQEMETLRTGNVDSGAALIMRAVQQTAAASMIAHVKGKSLDEIHAAAVNLSSFANMFGVRFLDFITTSDTGRVQSIDSHGAGIPSAKDHFFQESPAGNKGSVDFEADGRAVLHALQNPDVSTVIHELGHVFRRHLTKGEQAQIDTWLHSKVPGSKWSVADEEKFARAFERYVYDGEAPTTELAGPFARLKEWMLAIYTNLAGSPIGDSLSPQVRKVFDRMFIVDGLRVQVQQGRLLREQLGDPAAEILAAQHLILGEEPDDIPAFDRPAPRAPTPLNLPEAPDSVAAFLENPARIGAPLKELLEIEASRISDSTAENFVIDGYRKAASHSTAPEWYLELQRSLETSGSRMGKESIANALKKTAAGGFSKLTVGQQQAVLAGLDALARESSAAVHAIDPRTLKVGDRVTLPDLSTRTVIKGEKGELWLDNGQRLKNGEALQILGDVDPSYRHLATINDNPLDYRAESHLAELPDLDYVSHVETDGTEVRKKWRDTIDQAKTDLARERSRAGIYQRAAFCLGLGA